MIINGMYEHQNLLSLYPASFVVGLRSYQHPCIYLRTNSELCHLQHKLIGFYNRDEKCLQRGTDWVFK